MTDEEAKELGQRYLAAGGQWLPGMVDIWNDRFVRARATDEMHEPDFMDLATRGALFLFAESVACIHYDADRAWLHFDDMVDQWELRCEGASRWFPCEADTRVECALNVLESIKEAL